MDEFKRRYKETYSIVKDVVRLTDTVNPTYFNMHGVTEDCKYFLGYCAGYIYILDWDNKEIVNIIFDREGIGTPYELYDGDKYVIAPTFNGKVKVWEIPNGKEPVFIYNGKGVSELIRIKMVKDGKYIFGISNKRNMYAWRVGVAEPVMKIQVRRGKSSAFNISKNEKYIVVGYADGWVYLYELGKRYPVFKIRAYERYFLKDYGDGGYIRSWVEDDYAKIMDVGVTNDGENIVVLTDRGYVLVYFRGDRYNKHVRVMPYGRYDLVERYIKNDDTYDIIDCKDKVVYDYKIKVEDGWQNLWRAVKFIDKGEEIVLYRKLGGKVRYMDCKKYIINVKSSAEIEVEEKRYRWGGFIGDRVVVSYDGRYLACGYRYEKPEYKREKYYIKVFKLDNDFNIKREIRRVEMEILKDERLMEIIGDKGWVILKDSNDKKVRVRDIETWELVHEMDLYSEIKIKSKNKLLRKDEVKYIKDKGWLVFGLENRCIEVRDVNTWDLIYNWSPNRFLRRIVFNMALSNNNKHMFLGFSRRDAMLFDLEERRHIRYLWGLDANLWSVDVNDRGDALLGVFRTINKFYLWRIENGKFRKKIFKFESISSNDGSRFVKFLDKDKFIIATNNNILILYKYNINEHNIREINRYYLPGSAKEVDMIGFYLYVMNGAGDLMHIDIREL